MPVISSHTSDAMQASFARLKARAQEDAFPSAQVRKQNLARLKAALLQYEIPLLEALQQDYGHRSHEESRLIELLPTMAELKHAKAHLAKWMRPSKRNVHISTLPASAKVHYQPKGVIGVISPWNYPVLLCLGPLIGALAAGNRVMMKVSEFCPATNQVLRTLLDQSLGDEWVELVEGEANTADAFTQLAFDHLLFTGSTQVGRIVMQNAAKNLVPVTLELGGKSPLLVAPSANLKETAQRLVFGKLLNSGQTCVAPDYVFCQHGQKEVLIGHIKQVLRDFYPQGISSPDYTSLINERQLVRLKGYLDEAQSAGVVCENLLPQGPAEEDGKLALHILHQPSDDLRVMQDEIFGPLLPILEYSKMDEALAYIHQRPRPLAMYLFSNRAKDRKLCENHIASGSLVVNHTIIQVAQPDLPFGGVGSSGVGAYHAEEGFLTFSHGKSVLHKRGPNLAGLFSPPYKRRMHRLMAKVWSYL